MVSYERPGLLFQAFNNTSARYSLLQVNYRAGTQRTTGEGTIKSQPSGQEPIRFPVRLTRATMGSVCQIN